MNTPKPLKLDRDEPKMFVQKVGFRWQSWVEIGFCRVEREYGTYSWTRERAEKKARRLMEYAKGNQNPVIEVPE